jgi:hypothetical protein
MAPDLGTGNAEIDGSAVFFTSEESASDPSFLARAPIVRGACGTCAAALQLPAGTDE